MKVDKGFANDGSIVANPTATIADFVLDGPATKTVLAIDESTGATFTFANEDILGVYPYNPLQGDQVRFTVKAQDASSCTFNGSGYALESGQKYAAYYPGDLANADKAMMTKIPVDYTNQAQAALNTFDISAADYLVANGIEPANGVCDFKMSHIGALLVMDVTPAVAGTYKSLCIAAADATFIDKGTVDLTQEITVPNDGTPAQGITITPVNASNEVGLSLGGETGLALEAGTTYRFCMMIAPVDMTGKSLTLSLANGDEFISAPIAAKNFKQGYAYKIEAAPAAAAPSEPVNLSANGTANSYIVSEAGDYYFDATVAGNGVVNAAFSAWTFTSNADQMYPLNTSVIAGNGARLNWAQNGCISDVAYDTDNNTITFKASGAKGNAKVTLTNGGSDVWTWHIWCTDEPSTATFSNTHGTWKVMDRNLGAITTEPGYTDAQYGLYYQFGNPIPYTVAEFLNATNYESGNYYTRQALTTPDRPNIKCNAAWMWCTTYNADNGGFGGWLPGLFWGGFATILGDAYYTKNPAKYLHDPCPVGYKVMPYALLEGTTLDAGTDGRVLTGTDGSVYFPCNGLVFNDGYQWGEDWYIAIWTSRHYNGDQSQYFLASKSDAGSLSTQPTSRGMGVRCVKE